MLTASSDPPREGLRCQAPGYSAYMEAASVPRHPVLHYLAVVRAARDFGLGRRDLDTLTARFPPGQGSIDKLVAALTAALLERR